MSDPTDIEFTIGEVKAILQKHAMKAAGRAMIRGGELLMANREPTQAESDEISALTGACDALTALGKELGWLPQAEEEEPKAPTAYPVSLAEYSRQVDNA